MIMVNVWEAAWHRYVPFGEDGSPGHTSIEIGGVYVSFWPGNEVGLLKWQGFATKSLNEDRQKYSAAGQKHWFRNLPDDALGPGLNEQAMLQRWDEIKKSGANYTVKLQCSAVVNQLLIAGGSQNFAKPNLLDLPTWYLGAVSPDDVKDYTLLLLDRINTARSK